ncbi:FecR family protein [Chitinophaga vietnamensis]|uniref:FecR family protein n=1 Tax=Chitinophaga vietnamensis TaxID=2593957 RepID=UPI001375A826|nr:FecR domain-containing protein [Chitinophaga vietnamensis]
MDLQQYKAEDFILNDSFVRYCLRSNDSDVQFWESWLQRYPHKREEAEKAREWLFRLGLKLTPEEKEAEFGKLQLAIAAANDTTAPAQERPSPAARRYWRIAAAVLLPLAAIAWWMKAGQHKPVIADNNANAYTVYVAGDSARRPLVLADGSRVILNRHSTLRVPENYNKGSRHLELQGEALFEVAPAPEQPFTVSSQGAEVRALGTAFKVRAYGFDTAMAVSLLEGRVRVAVRSSATELQPGEQVLLKADASLFDKHGFDMAREAAWRKGLLAFNNASIREITEQLQYWYGIKVQLMPGKYKPIRFNGAFRNKPLNEVLAAICFVNGLTSTIKNDTLLISPASASH